MSKVLMGSLSPAVRALRPEDWQTSVRSPLGVVRDAVEVTQSDVVGRSIEPTSAIDARVEVSKTVCVEVRDRQN